MGRDVLRTRLLLYMGVRFSHTDGVHHQMWAYKSTVMGSFNNAKHPGFSVLSGILLRLCLI